MKHLAITVRGRVQGVGFRYYAKAKARDYGVRGFVKNEANASVYIEAEGSDDAMEAFILWLKKGPPLARVDQISAYEIPEQNFEDFVIR
ncbi:MAG: acylphosphatase [Bacteroidales bacterium]|jgi:acylphosphatase|nr:acylphosphatase [Bacteroidales bacterium]